MNDKYDIFLRTLATPRKLSTHLHQATSPCHSGLATTACSCEGGSRLLDCEPLFSIFNCHAWFSAQVRAKKWHVFGVQKPARKLSKKRKQKAVFKMSAIQLHYPLFKSVVFWSRFEHRFCQRIWCRFRGHLWMMFFGTSRSKIEQIFYVRLGIELDM